MQVFIKWILFAVLDWLLGLATKTVKIIISHFKKRKESEDLDKKLEDETDLEKREELSDEILNGTKPKP